MLRRVPSGEDAYVGLVLDRQFRVEELIGTGAMALVYRARQLPIDRDVAVKILRPELVAQKEIAARFRREAHIAARLEHPNVIVVHAVGEVPRAPGVPAEPYAALELLAGPSLGAALDAAGGTLPLERALHVVLALCDAVGEAHAQGIVHRDLKPENVMLVRRGGDPDFVKILDFGLAKTLDDEADLKTRAGAVLGTPRYVSPEGAEGKPVSQRSDCYALATLLYRCLAGRTPFEGENAVSILVQQTTGAPPPLRSIDAARGVPEPIADVVMQNLSKRPDARAPDARAFGRALVTAARKSSVDVEAMGLSTTLLGTAAKIVPRVEPVAVESQRSADPAPSAPRASAPAPSRGVPRRRAGSLLLTRLFLFVACFLLGVVAALGIAASLGAFEPTSRGEVE